MSLSDIASRLERVSATASSAGRQLLGLDTNPVSADWTHITKVDPEGEKQLPLCFPLYLSHTSAISVGGSRAVTDENTEETFELLEYAPVPAFHEPSDAGHVTETTREHSEFLAIPEVLNGDSEALVGTLGKGIEYVREDLGPAMIEEKLGLSMDGTIGRRLSNFAAAYMLDSAVYEAYIIMNTDSAAAREANVSEDDLLEPAIAKQRALAAEYHLESEVIYLEYSGTFGGEQAQAILTEIDDAVTWPRLWYGGGLDNRENAQAVLDAGADAVIVGDIFHSIATEEADLIEQAREEFDEHPDRETIREFVEERVTLEETSAARYLSTITAVPNPDQRALKYLSTGVEIALELDKFDDSSETQTLPGESAFADVLSDSDATEFADRLATLAADGDGDSDAVSAQHIGPSL